MQVKNKEKTEIANDGTEHMVRTSNNKTLHRKLIPTQVNLQRSPKRHKQRKVRECVGIITEAEEGIIFESKPKAGKVDSDEEDTDIEYFHKSDGKSVHVDIDKKVTNWTKPSLALLPNRIEEDRINQNGEKSDGDGNIGLRRSNRIPKPLEKETTQEEPPKPRLMTMEEIDLDYNTNEDKYRIEGGECYAVNSVNPVMQPYWIRN